MKLSPIGATVSLAMSAALGGCAIMNTSVEPVTEHNLCSHESLPRSHGANTLDLFGDMEKKVGCAERWRDSYHQALHENTKGDLGKAHLSASTIYLGIPDLGNNDKVATRAGNAKSIYSANRANSPGARNRVYAAGFWALTCAMLQSRPRMMTVGEYNRLSSAIDYQSHQLEKLRGAVARYWQGCACGGGYSAANVAVAENTLNVMRASLDRAHAAQHAITHGGGYAHQRVLGVVKEVEIQLKATDPDPEAIRAEAGKLHLVWSGVPGNGAIEDMCAGPTGQCEPNDCPPHSAISDLGQAISDAEVGAERLRPLIERLQRIEAATATIEGCSDFITKGTTAGLVITPDQARISMVEGDSFRLTVRSDIGIPDVRLVGNAAGALEWKPTVGPDYLEITLYALAPSENDVRLTIRAANRESRTILVKVRARETRDSSARSIAKAACHARSPDTAVWRRHLDRSECELLKGRDDVRALQCSLGTAAANNLGIVRRDTRDRIAIANRAFGLGREGDKVTRPLLDALAEDRACPEAAESLAALHARLRKLPKAVVAN